MAYCLTAPSYYLNQCWLNIKKSCGIHVRALSLGDVTIKISKTRLITAFLKCHPEFPGSSELTWLLLTWIRSTNGVAVFVVTNPHRRQNRSYKFSISLDHLDHINSLGPDNVIWWHRFEATLVQVMVCCLMAPSHYLNQCWLIFNEFQW